MLFYLWIILALIIFILTTLAFIMKTPSTKMKREKLSSFECGFDPDHKMRAPFSLRFFIITIIFLIFDVEITILFPIPISTSMNMFKMSASANFLLFGMLMGGLLFEWKQGALEWSWTFI